MKLVGSRIKTARLERKLSLEELGELAGSDRGTMSRLERAQSPEIAFAIVMAVCDVLGQDPNAIWAWPEATAPAPTTLAKPSTVPPPSNKRPRKTG